MKIEIGQIFTQIISFLALLWVLKRYGWKPLLDVLEERKTKIRAEFDSIEKQKKQAESLKDAYQKQLDEIEELSKKKMQETEQIAKDAANKIEKEANEKAKEMLLQAKEHVQKDLLKAKGLLKKELVDITFNATEKLLKETMNEDTQKRLIEDLIEQRNFS